MMSERGVAQETLFHECSLELHVQAVHMLRAIDRVIDLLGLQAHLQPFSSAMGRPSTVQN